MIIKPFFSAMDDESGEIKTVNLSDKSSIPTVYDTDFHHVFSLKVYSKNPQKGSKHPCQSEPNVCKDLCLINPLGRNCRCREGTESQAETCIPINGWRQPSPCRLVLAVFMKLCKMLKFIFI